MHKVFLALGGLSLLAAVGLYVWGAQGPAAEPSVAEELAAQSKKRRKIARAGQVGRKKSQPTPDDRFARQRKCAAGLIQFCEETTRSARPAKERYTMSSRALDAYLMDSHSFDMALRTAAIIGRKGKTSPQSLRFYQDVAGRSEKACRMRNPLACWHRAQLAEYSRDRRHTQWKKKAKVLAGDLMKSCGKKKSTVCDHAREVLTKLAH